MNTHLVVV